MIAQALLLTLAPTGAVPLEPALLRVETPVAVLQGLASDRRVELPPAEAEWLDPAPWFSGAEAVLGVSFEGAGEPIGLTGEAGRVRVELADGDRLEAALRGGVDESLRVQVAGGILLELPIDVLRSIVLPRNVSGTTSFEAPKEGDRLYRRTSGGLDRIDGAVVGFNDQGVQFESLLGEQGVPWTQVAAVFVEVFEDMLAREPGPGPKVALDLVDGSRIRGEMSGVRADGVRLSWRGGDSIVPLVAIAAVVPADGRVGFLSELEPIAVDEGSPFGDDLGMVWPHRRDRAIDGAPLRAGGRLYPRGLGVHAPSVLTFDVGGGADARGAWRELRGRVALDDQVLDLPARGSVVFRVHVDGELRWSSPVLRGGDAPLAFPPIALAGAKRLELEVDMAGELHLGDRADWLQMQLLR